MREAAVARPQPPRRGETSPARSGGVDGRLDRVVELDPGRVDLRRPRTRARSSSACQGLCDFVGRLSIATRAAMVTALVARTRYAKSGDVNIAYQVVGEGPVDIVNGPGWVPTSSSHGSSRMSRLFERLASFARLILFDKRGTGMSDRVAPRSADARAADGRRARRDGRRRVESGGGFRRLRGSSGRAGSPGTTSRRAGRGRARRALALLPTLREPGLVVALMRMNCLSTFAT